VQYFFTTGVEVEMESESVFTVGQYLLKRLEQLGINQIFGVPGDFVLKFCDQIIHSPLQFINTCNELNGGYAADGYARINRIGALVVTYGPGALSAINAIAASFAEHIPVIIISGSPDTKYHRAQTPWHHTLGDYRIPKKMFAEITVASEVLMDPVKAPGQIDSLISACLLNQRPVYLEIPMDIAESKCRPPREFVEPARPASDHVALQEAVSKALSLLTQGTNPVILVGMEVDRFQLQEEVLKLIEKTGYPFSTMAMGKAILSERHPQYIGMYQGASTPDYVRNRVERASTILSIGTIRDDANLGGFTAVLDEEKLIQANISDLEIQGSVFKRVMLSEFLVKLTAGLSLGDPDDLDIKPLEFSYYDPRANEYIPEAGKILTVDRLFERMAHFLKTDDIVVAEVGTSMFSALQTTMPEKVKFIGQSFYGSIGFTLPAALGAAMANRDRRVVLFIGDGSFQLTCQELSTMIRNGLTPKIFLVNNQGYTMERLIHDGPYNDIQPWRNHALPEIFGGPKGMEVRTEDDLEWTLDKVETTTGLTFTEIYLGKWEHCRSLQGMLHPKKSNAGEPADE
jgi:TPP-dependent 2-oxoacid decarboxylase